MEDLKYHSILDDAGNCYFQFKVKPTERYWKLVEAFTQLSVLAKGE